MKFSLFKGTVGVTAASLATLGFATDTFPATHGSAKKAPNFVIIYTDDQGYNDLSCFGSAISTPNIDKICNEGAKFTDCYAGAPVCSPSRAALLTGCYPSRVGFSTIPDVIWGGTGLGLHWDEITIAKLLKTKGYATGCVGKWHLGEDKPFRPLSHGFDSYYGIIDGPDMGATLYRNDTKISYGTDLKPLTGQFTKEACQYITDNKDRPFFLYMAHFLPHIPNVPSDSFIGKSGAGLYGDAVMEIDWSTGQIMAKLKELGLDSNTLVIYTSDNGPNQKYMQPGALHYGDPVWAGGSAYPLSGYKWDYQLDGGMREPCVMRWPGVIPEGLICSEIITQMDFFTTFAKLASAEIPSDRIIDGKDILPLMTGVQGAVSPWDSAGFLYSKPAEPGKTGVVVLRSGKWKFKWIWGDSRLYDLSKDIGEKVKVTSANPAVAARLLELTHAVNDSLYVQRRPLGNIKNYVSSEQEISKTGRIDKKGDEIVTNWYYNLKGQRISASQINSLPKGIYFRKTISGRAIKFIKL